MSEVLYSPHRFEPCEEQHLVEREPHCARCSFAEDDEIHDVQEVEH